MKRGFSRQAVCLLLLAVAASFRIEAACTTQGCVMAGPRLANLNTTQGALLNPLLGAMLGTTLNVDVLDWQKIAGGDVDVAKMINLLSASPDISDTGTALSTSTFSIAQILNAAASATTGVNAAAASVALQSLALNPTFQVPNIKLVDLISVGAAPGNTTINALDLVTGVVQTYNKQNVATTTTPVTISTASLSGLTGIGASITLYAQVVEPPIYTCGGSTTQFHTSAIRLKINVTLSNSTPSGANLLTILGLSAPTVSLGGNLSIYVEVARANGTIGTLDAVANAMNLTATPGVADIYVGTISDAVFFSRARVLPLTISDFGYADIGQVGFTLTLNNFLGVSTPIAGLTSRINIRTYAHGQSPIADSWTAQPAYPNTHTATTGVGFVTTLVSDLVTNLQISISLNLSLLNILQITLPDYNLQVANALKPIVGGVLSPVLGGVLNGLVNPVFDLIGLKLGEAAVTAYGVYNLCSVSGLVYNDANHSALYEVGEVGTGLTLYAKMISTSTPTTVYRAGTVNTSTGVYSFANLVSGSYTLIVDNNNTTSDVSATRPTAWVATEVPTLSRSLTVSTVDLPNQNYGLYNGSNVSGRIFVDTGVGSGTANNAVKDGTEPSLPGVSVKATDNAGTTTYDTTTSADSGTYMLWIPASAGAVPVKIVEMNTGAYVSTGGNAGATSGTYTRATDTVSFTNAVGTSYTGIEFADVPTSALITDGQQTILPGAAAFYPHRFTAGTAGQVTISASATAATGWGQQVFVDANCNGVVDSGENPVSAAISLTAAQFTCVVVKVNSPPNAPFNTHYPITLTADFQYANSAITDQQTRSDMTIAGSPTDAGLVLAKSVDKTAVAPGQTLTYTITYTNSSSAALGTLKVFDSTPGFTVFASAVCETLGTGLTGCSVVSPPTVGTAGALQWSFVGSLTPGASGTVAFTVTVQQ